MDSKEIRMRILELACSANEISQSTKAGATLHMCFMRAKEMAVWVEYGEVLVHQHGGKNLRLGDKVRTKPSQQDPLGFEGQIATDILTENGRFIGIRPEHGEIVQFKVQEVDLL